MFTETKFQINSLSPNTSSKSLKELASDPCIWCKTWRIRGSSQVHIRNSNFHAYVDRSSPSRSGPPISRILSKRVPFSSFFQFFASKKVLETGATAWLSSSLPKCNLICFRGAKWKGRARERKLPSDTKILVLGCVNYQREITQLRRSLLRGSVERERERGSERCIGANFPWRSTQVSLSLFLFPAFRSYAGASHV